MRDGERLRAPQRKLLNDFFNGESPWTAKEAADNHILINFNDKQGTNLLRQARNQYENAFAKRDIFFKVFLTKDDDERTADYEDIITTQINRVINNSLEFYYTNDEVWGGVCLHGVGAKMWYDEDGWKPVFKGIQDILIPTDTHLSMDNLQCFAVRHRMRPGELANKTIALGKNVHPGWNLKAVGTILDDYKDLNTNPGNINYADEPERVGEIWKQSSGGFYDLDTAPTIDFWDFYHREEGSADKPSGWYHKLVLDKDCVAGRGSNTTNPMQFIFESKKPIASLQRIIHFQFGDGNNVPPFMYHSIRSLAYLTYDLVWMMNRLNCQFTQHIFEQLMTMVRVQSHADQGRLSKVSLAPPFCVIPPGLDLVAGNERYKADYNLIEGGLAQYKQRIGDLTSAYTQQLDTGPSSEARTKFEVQALLAQTSALMSSMLGRAYRQEHWACVEIARRFTIENSHDFEVKKFQNDCILAGVPRKYLDSKLWNIEVEQVLGNGNRAMELAEATELFTNMAAFDPAFQQEIKHDWLLAVTGNSKKAKRGAPLDKKLSTSNSANDAENKWGSLWTGAELNPPDGLNHIEQVTTLISLMATKIENLLQAGQPQESDLRGLSNVAVYIAKHLKIMGADEKLMPMVKKFTDDLKNLMGVVGKMAQQVQTPPDGNDPELKAKAQAIGTLAQTKAQTAQMLAGNKAQISQAQAKLKLQQKQESHDQKLAQTSQTHQFDEALKVMSARHDEQIKAIEAKNDLAIARIEALLAPKPKNKSASE